MKTAACPGSRPPGPRLAVALAAALLAGPAAAAPTWEMTFTLGMSPSAELGRGIRWTRKPSDPEVFALFPKDAFKARLSGVTLLECVTTAEGKLAGCAVVEEKPEGMGFAQASIAVLAMYEFGPRDRIKPEMVGRKLKAPIVWTTKRNKTREVRP